MALEFKSQEYGAGPTAMVKALIDSIIQHDLIDTLLVGVDVKAYDGRRRGRVKGREQPPKIKRKPVFFLNGEPITVKEMVFRSGVASATIRDRIKRGMTPEQAMANTKYWFRRSAR